MGLRLSRLRIGRLNFGTI